jgi:hypothetical protein
LPNRLREADKMNAIPNELVGERRAGGRTASGSRHGSDGVGRLARDRKHAFVNGHGMTPRALRSLRMRVCGAFDVYAG